MATTIEQLEDIVCDMCGASCGAIEWGGGIRDFEAAYFWASWGYGSSHDGEIWDSDLCMNCAYQVKEFIEAKGGRVLITEQ